MLVKLLHFNQSPDSLIFTLQDKEKKLYRAEVPTDDQTIYSRWYDLCLCHLDAQKKYKDVYLKDPILKNGTVELVPDQKLNIKILEKFSEATVFKLKPVEQKESGRKDLE